MVHVILTHLLVLRGPGIHLKHSKNMLLIIRGESCAHVSQILLNSIHQGIFNFVSRYCWKPPALLSTNHVPGAMDYAA